MSVSSSERSVSEGTCRVSQGPGSGSGCPDMASSSRWSRTWGDWLHVDTIGGFVVKRLGRQPAPGDHIELGGYRLVVEEVSGFKIVRLRFDPCAPAPSA